MAGLWTTLWWSLVDTCRRLCDKLRYEDPELKPFPGPVPEDILMEIFSRIPAECLHQCKLAYEDWNTLFSTTYFNHNLFLPRASPTILVQCRAAFEKKLFYIDDDHRGGLRCKKILLEHPGDLMVSDPIRFSSYGLIFFEERHPLFNIMTIVNPVTGRWVYVPRISDYYAKGDICGAFFHPTAREFGVLWVSSWTRFKNINSHVKFKMLRPRSDKHPQLRWTALSKLQSRPMTDEPPVNLHDRLHWMCYKYESARFLDIMVFSIVSEEFKLMPSIPSVQGVSRMHLLDLDGCLSIWELTDGLNIWTVEEYYASWSWTKRYNIQVELLDKRIKINEVAVVGFQNGALVIHWMGKGIFVYHLQHKTAKKILLGKLKGSEYYSFTTAFLHTKSLISVNGFTKEEYKHCPFVM